MTPLDIAAATTVAVIWGIAFVVSKMGLTAFTPPQLTALRFIVAAIPALWLPRPASWGSLIAIGLTMFTGQFLLQFFGIASGMPAGLTAVVVQTQALFTVLFAALALGEKPNIQQSTGMLIAFLGLAIVGLTLGGDVTVTGFALTLLSAVSWAIGNMFVKRLRKVDMLHLVVWASLVPPAPALVISWFMDGPRSLSNIVAEASWSALAAPIYLGLVSTTLAYAAWNKLLHHYSAGSVAPFALLAPCVGAVASALFLGESFGPVRFAGIAVILVGIAIVALPPHRFRA